MADSKSVDDVENMNTRIARSRFSGEFKRGLTQACDEADTRSSDRGASTQPTSMKSEITIETNLPLGNGKTHDSQHKTESSCSNSLPVVLPFSNQRETFKEACLFGSSMDSSNSKAFDRSPEEPVTASSESGLSAQIASEVIGNAKTTLENDVGEVFEQTDNLDSFNCTSKAAQSTRLCHGRENLPTSHLGERMEFRISREGGKALENGPRVKEKIKREFWVDEYCDSSMTKVSKNPVNDGDKFIAGFDLNEDINANALSDCIRPLLETVPSHRVIHVVAKAGIPIGQPMIPLKFEGGLGWKGSARTSAFRPASLSKNLNRKACSTNHGPKEEQCFTGIDLNVAAIEDSDAKETQLGVDSKQTKSLWIDLNCASSDEFTQPSLNLSSDTSLADKSKNVNCSHPGKQEFGFASHDYWAKFSTTQHIGSSGHTLFPAPNFLQPMELMHREDSVQPKLHLILHTLPPHSYSYRDPFHFGVESIPYTRYYGEHASFNAPYLGRVVHEQSTSNISASTPKFDDRIEGNLSVRGSRIEDCRQFPFPSRNLPMVERVHQEAWYAASMKRKEPEGGLECYQLGHK